MKYIDAEKLIAKIERRKNESRELAQEHKNSSLGNAAQTMANEDEEILSLIASLQKEQPSLPSNLDEAAEKYSENILANNEDLQDAIEDAFKAGAEWVAGQGQTIESLVWRDEDDKLFIEAFIDENKFKMADNIIIQIRKK